MPGRKIGSISPKADRKIIGISLPPALASKVKAEVGRRQMRLRDFFIELWELYEKHGAPKKKP